MPSEGPDGDQIEHFLVDGVAPPVIGGGPPESPFELAPDTGPEPRHRAGDMPYDRPGPSHEHAGSVRREPPTAPIPVIDPGAAAPEKRRSWVSRVFRLPGS